MAAPKKRKREPPFDVTGIDFSVITTSLKTGGRMIEQIMNGIQYGSPEVRLLMMEECDFIIECRVCRGLFRALPNFIAHKRVYCCEAYCNYNPHSHFQPTATYPDPTVVLEPTAPDETASHSSGRTSPTDSILDKSERQSRESSASREKERSGSSQRLTRTAANSNKQKGKIGTSEGKAEEERNGKLGLRSSEDSGNDGPGTRTRSQLSDGAEQGLQALKDTVSQIEAGKLGHSKQYALLTGAAEKMEREKRQERTASAVSLTSIPTTRHAVYVTRGSVVENVVTPQTDSETSTPSGSDSLPVSEKEQAKEEEESTKKKTQKEPGKESSESSSKKAGNASAPIDRNTSSINSAASDGKGPSYSSKASDSAKTTTEFSADVSGLKKSQARIGIGKATLRNVTRVVRELRKKKEESSAKEQASEDDSNASKSTHKETQKVSARETSSPSTSSSQLRATAKRQEPVQDTQQQKSASTNKDQSGERSQKDDGPSGRVTPKPATVPATLKPPLSTSGETSQKGSNSDGRVTPSPTTAPAPSKPQLRQSARNADSSAERQKGDQQTKFQSSTTPATPVSQDSSPSQKSVGNTATTQTPLFSMVSKSELRQSARLADADQEMRPARKPQSPRKHTPPQRGVQSSEKSRQTTPHQHKYQYSIRRQDLAAPASRRHSSSPKKNSNSSPSEKAVPQPAVLHQLRHTVITAEASSSSTVEETDRDARSQRSTSSSPRRDGSPSARSESEDGNLRAVVKRCLTGRPWALRTGSVNRGSDAGSVSDTESVVDREEPSTVMESPAPQDSEEEIRPALDLENLCCRLCNIKFSQKKSLSYHCQTHHSGARTIYPCPYCQRVFYYLWGLTRHLGTNHKIKPSNIERMRKSLRRRAFKQDIADICISVVKHTHTSSTEEQDGDQPKPRHSVPARVAVANSTQGGSGQQNKRVAVELNLPPSLLSMLSQRKRRVEVIASKKTSERSRKSRGAGASTATAEESEERPKRIMGLRDRTNRSKRILAKALRVTRSKRVYGHVDLPQPPLPATRLVPDTIVGSEHNSGKVSKPSPADTQPNSLVSVKKPARVVSVSVSTPPPQTEHDQIPDTAKIEIIVHRQKTAVSNSTAGWGTEPKLATAGGSRLVTATVTTDASLTSKQPGTVSKQAISSPQMKLTASATETLAHREPVVMLSTKESGHKMITPTITQSLPSGPGGDSINTVVGKTVSLSQTSTRIVTTAASSSSVTTSVSSSPNVCVTVSKSSAVTSPVTSQASDSERASNSPHLTHTKTAQGGSIAGRSPTSRLGSAKNLPAHLTRARSSLTLSPRRSSTSTPSSPGLLHICTGCQRTFGRKISLVSHQRICSKAKALESASPKKRIGITRPTGQSPQKVVRDATGSRRHTPSRRDSLESVGGRASSVGASTRSSRDSSAERAEPKQRLPPKSTTSQAKQPSKDGLQTRSKDAAQFQSQQRLSRLPTNPKGSSSRESSVESRSAGDADTAVLAAERQSRSRRKPDSKPSSSRESSVDSVRTRSSDVRPYQLQPGSGRPRTVSVSSSGSSRDRSVESRRKESGERSAESRRKESGERSAESRRKESGDRAMENRRKESRNRSIESRRKETIQNKRKSDEDLLALSRKRLSEQLQQAASTSASTSDTKVKADTGKAAPSPKPQPPRTITTTVLRKSIPDKLSASPRKMAPQEMPESIVLVKKTLPGTTVNLPEFEGRVLRKAQSSPKEPTSTVTRPRASDQQPLSRTESSEVNKHTTDKPASIQRTNQSQPENSEVAGAPEMVSSEAMIDLEEEEDDNAESQGEGSSMSGQPPVTASEEENQRPRRKRRAPSRLVDGGAAQEDSDNEITAPSKKANLESSEDIINPSKKSPSEAAPTTDFSSTDSQSDESITMETEESGGEDDGSTLVVEEIWMDKKPGRPTERVKSNRIYVVVPAHSGRLTCQDTRKVRQIVDESWLTCLQCDQKFTSVSNLRRHAIRHLGWRRFKCRLCRFCSYNRSECNSHIIRSHPERIRSLGSVGGRIDTFIIDLNRQAASVRSLKKRQTLDSRRRQGEEEGSRSGGGDIRRSSRRKLREGEEERDEAVAGTSDPHEDSTPEKPDATTHPSGDRKSTTPVSHDSSKSKRLTSTAFNISTRNSPRTFDTRPYPRPGVDSKLNTRKGSYTKSGEPSLTRTAEEESRRTSMNKTSKGNGDIVMSEGSEVGSEKHTHPDADSKLNTRKGAYVKLAAPTLSQTAEEESKRASSNSKTRESVEDIAAREVSKVVAEKHIRPDADSTLTTRKGSYTKPAAPSLSGTAEEELKRDSSSDKTKKNDDKSANKVSDVSQADTSQESMPKEADVRVLKSRAAETTSQKADIRASKSHSSEVPTQVERASKSHERKSHNGGSGKSSAAEVLADPVEKSVAGGDTMDAAEEAEANYSIVASFDLGPVPDNYLEERADLETKVLDLIPSTGGGKSGGKDRGTQGDNAQTMKVARRAPNTSLHEDDEAEGLKKHHTRKTDDSLLEVKLEAMETLPKHFMSDDASPASVEMSEDN